MAIIKCKMCGGDIELSADKTFGVCEYCGSTMTFPKIDDEHRAAAFNRGNHFRRIGEFDKALAIYENIVRENDDDAEAHWCCALCRFGIEYVEDPASHEWLPTCHRASFDSILEDVDYQAALEHSDGVTRRQYEKDAMKIAEVQRGILATSQKEEPFDVFICYKETDDSGQRTRDSMLAQDVYYQLTEKGYRVFFARITLEDKAGSEYEPYIFAALNSAKVMICIGTKPEHFNAVWVKNEWSRFLALMRKDRKKLLLPCYRDMDPYDLPEQLSVLQSYDMSKIGFIQDLIRGVSKVVDAEKAQNKPAQTVVVNQGSSSVNQDALLKRGNMALEDGDWASADKYFDRVLDANAECAEAYLGKTLAEAKCVNLDAFVAQRTQRKPVSEELFSIDQQTEHIQEMVRRHAIPGYLAENELQALYRFDLQYKSRLKGERAHRKEEEEYWRHHKQLGRALRFASGEFKEKLNSALTETLSKLDAHVAEAEQADRENKATKEKSYAAFLKKIDDHVESVFVELTERRECDYSQACEKQERAQNVGDNQLAIELFKMLYGYKDSDERIEQCKDAIQRLIDAQNLAKENEKKEKDYQSACKLQDDAKTDSNYEWAIKRFKDLQDYKDSEKHIQQCEEAIERLHREERRNAAAKKRKKIIVATVFVGIIVTVAPALAIKLFIVPSNHYKSAEALLAAGDYDNAIAEFAAAGNYNDAVERVSGAHYAQGEALLAAEDYEGSIAAFAAAGEYSDATERLETVQTLSQQASDYAEGEALLASTDFDGAIAAFQSAGSFKNAKECVKKAHYAKGDVLQAAKDYEGAITEFKAAGNYSNATERLEMSYYAQAEIHEEAGELAKAAIAYGRADEYADAVERSRALWAQVAERNTIAVGIGHTVALKSNGMVVAVGNNISGQCDVSDWKDIVAVAAGGANTVGLKSDGTVVAVGRNYEGQCNVSGWTDIVAVVAGGDHTVGLKSDGTVVAAGENEEGQCNVSGWTDIVAVVAGNDHTVGLKSDGTVVAVGENDDGECGVSDWTDIIAVGAGWNYTVGLKSDGTVVAAGENEEGQCNVSDWTDIVAVAAGDYRTVGLKSDGTVVAVGENDDGECDVSDWTDIIAVGAGWNYTVGLKSDGTVIAAGENEKGQCNVSGWTDIVAVVTGDLYIVGLKSNGMVVAVGDNGTGQCNVYGWTNIKLPYGSMPNEGNDKTEDTTPELTAKPQPATTPTPNPTEVSNISTPYKDGEWYVSSDGVLAAHPVNLRKTGNSYILEVEFRQQNGLYDMGTLEFDMTPDDGADDVSLPDEDVVGSFQKREDGGYSIKLSVNISVGNVTIIMSKTFGLSIE